MAELLPSYLDSADSNTQRKCVTDFLGYQSLIKGTSQGCCEGKWVIYDHRFHLKASATQTKQ